VQGIHLELEFAAIVLEAVPALHKIHVEALVAPTAEL